MPSQPAECVYKVLAYDSVNGKGVRSMELWRGIVSLHRYLQYLIITS